MTTHTTETRVITRGLPDTWYDIELTDSRFMKYVVGLHPLYGRVMILFTPMEGLHSEVFEQFALVSCESAGYVDQPNDPGTYKCYGESTSLHMHSRPEDTVILNDHVQHEKETRE